MAPRAGISSGSPKMTRSCGRGLKRSTAKATPFFAMLRRHSARLVLCEDGNASQAENAPAPRSTCSRGSPLKSSSSCCARRRVSRASPLKFTAVVTTAVPSTTPLSSRRRASTTSASPLYANASNIRWPEGAAAQPKEAHVKCSGSSADPAKQRCWGTRTVFASFQEMGSTLRFVLPGRYCASSKVTFTAVPLMRMRTKLARSTSFAQHAQSSATAA
mmetsp:Transcript_8935/g.29526  ORF Transcript_8935/g.29526 Transcript_8935/m.29526 type:complete len:217 (-) Transcript_8935:64-714(-)